MTSNDDKDLLLMGTVPQSAAPMCSTLTYETTYILHQVDATLPTHDGVMRFIEYKTDSHDKLLARMKERYQQEAEAQRQQRARARRCNRKRNKAARASRKANR